MCSKILSLLVVVVVISAFSAQAWGDPLFSVQFGPKPAGGPVLQIGDEALAAAYDAAYIGTSPTWNIVTPTTGNNGPDVISATGLADRNGGLTTIGFSTNQAVYIWGEAPNFPDGPTGVYCNNLAWGPALGTSATLGWQISGLTPGAPFKFVLYGMNQGWGADATVDTSGDGLFGAGDSTQPVGNVGPVYPVNPPPKYFTGTVASDGIVRGQSIRYAGNPGAGFDAGMMGGFQLSLGAVPSTTYNWSGGGSGDLWSTTANWNNTVPGAGNVAIFADVGATKTAVDLGASDVTIAGLTFNGNLSNINIAATTNSTKKLILDNTAVALPAPVSVAGTQTISANVQLTSTANISTVSGAQLTIGGNISGTGTGITLAGPGKLVLSGSNTYSGPTAISEGTLQLDGSMTGPLNVSGGTVNTGSGAAIATGAFSGGTVSTGANTLAVSSNLAIGPTGATTYTGSGANFLVKGGNLASSVSALTVQAGGTVTATLPGGNKLFSVQFAPKPGGSPELQSGDEPSAAVAYPSAFTGASATWNVVSPTATNNGPEVISQTGLTDRNGGASTIGFSTASSVSIFGYPIGEPATNKVYCNNLVFGAQYGLTPTNTLDWQISGLTPGASFKLVLYGFTQGGGASATVDTTGDGSLGAGDSTQDVGLHGQYGSFNGYGNFNPTQTYFDGTVGPGGIILGQSVGYADNYLHWDPNWLPNTGGMWSGFQLSLAVAQVQFPDVTMANGTTTFKMDTTLPAAIGTLTLEGGAATLAGDANIPSAVWVGTIKATGTGTLDLGSIPLAISGNLDVDSGKKLTLNADIQDGATATTLTKIGDGTAVLTGNNQYTGGTVVSFGTLEIATANSLPAGQALTIGASGTVVLSSGLSAAGAGAGSAVSANAVPEPGTIALLAAGLLGLAVAAWRKRK